MRSSRFPFLSETKNERKRHMLETTVIPLRIIEDFRDRTRKIGGEYHISREICALFKQFDLILVKKVQPNQWKIKRIVNWRDQTNENINEMLMSQEWL
jgi:hypothetical protein